MAMFSFWIGEEERLIYVAIVIANSQEETSTKQTQRWGMLFSISWRFSHWRCRYETVGPKVREICWVSHLLIKQERTKWKPAHTTCSRWGILEHSRLNKGQSSLWTELQCWRLLKVWLMDEKWCINCHICWWTWNPNFLSFHLFPIYFIFQ